MGEESKLAFMKTRPARSWQVSQVDKKV